MELNRIVREFKKVNEKIEVIPSEKPDRWTILTPHMFSDGDHIVVALKQKDGKWCLTDEGHTFMHLDTLYGTSICNMSFINKVNEILRLLDIMNIKDLLLVYLKEDNCREKLQSFIQGITKIIEVCNKEV